MKYSGLVALVALTATQLSTARPGSSLENHIELITGASLSYSSSSFESDELTDSDEDKIVLLNDMMRSSLPSEISSNAQGKILNAITIGVVTPAHWNVSKWKDLKDLAKPEILAQETNIDTELPLTPVEVIESLSALDGWKKLSDSQQVRIIRDVRKGNVLLGKLGVRNWKSALELSNLTEVVFHEDNISQLKSSVKEIIIKVTDVSPSWWTGLSVAGRLRLWEIIKKGKTIDGVDVSDWRTLLEEDADLEHLGITEDLLRSVDMELANEERIVAATKASWWSGLTEDENMLVGTFIEKNIVPKTLGESWPAIIANRTITPKQIIAELLK